MNRGRGGRGGGRGWGGRGGGSRGGRGGYGRDRREDRRERDYNDRGPPDGEGAEGRPGRPPPGLRGKDIGLWFAKRGQARKEREQKMNRPMVSMDQRKEQNIRRLLSDLKDQDGESEGAGGAEPWGSSGAEGGQPPAKWQPEALPKPAWGAASKPQMKEEKTLSMAPPPDHWDDNLSDEDLAAMEDVSHIGKIGEPFPVEVVPPGQMGPGLQWGKGVVTVVDELAYMDTEDLKQDNVEVESDNPRLDQEMSDNANKLLNNPQFRKMKEFRKKLPSYQMRETIINAVRGNQVLVISGETGCGKTTQVPQFILDDYIERGIGSQCRVICTQPRRISAISVAERVASERCDKMNDSRQSSVGYQIRLEAKRPRTQGSILFCTTGIVLKFLEGDPSLQRATHVVIDEIHERDLQSDFLMIILKDLLLSRPDLKVILMSATLNAELFSQYFSDCPMLNIPGYTFPVKEYLLEEIIEMTGYQGASGPSRGSGRGRGGKRPSEQERQEEEDYRVWLRNLQGSYDRRTISVLENFDFSCIDLELIHHIIHHICTKMEDGAILVFVPGWEEIKKLHEMIQKTPQARSSSLRVIPLHSLMPTVNQREIFERPPPGVRKIVIATNIAETSITIDDVVFVIDCGKIKVKDFNPEVNITSLEPQWVSKANAKQRRGRAGRVQPGYCFHLYTAFRISLCRDYLPPEMLRTRLEELCLQIKLLRLGRIVPFISKAMQHPSMEAITRAVETLMDLNALDADENLLPLGYHLARMPVEPHTAKMILFGAMFCCLDPILTVAASLSFKDAFTIPLGKEALADKARKKLSNGSKSDHIMLVNAFSGWEESMKQRNSHQYCWDNFLSENTLRMLRDMKRQLAELLADTGFSPSRDPKDRQVNVNSNNLSLLRAVLCAGLYPNVAQVVKVPKPNSRGSGTVTMNVKDGSRVFSHPKSVNSEESYFESKWMVFYYKLKTSKVYVHDCTMVSPYPLLFFGGQIKALREDGQELVAVDDWIKFKAAGATAQLVRDLRRQLDKVLRQKITCPGPTTWRDGSAEAKVMAAIADLITTEDSSYAQGGDIGGSIGRKARDDQRAPERDFRDREGDHYWN